jgi:uncharacterized membrane protein
VDIPKRLFSFFGKRFRSCFRASSWYDTSLSTFLMDFLRFLTLATKRLLSYCWSNSDNLKSSSSLIVM